MRFFLMAVMTLAAAAAATAQRPADEILDDIRLSAGTYAAYRYPERAGQTDPPEGKKPFYISLLGNPGSHHLADADDYRQPLRDLQKASADGNLTLIGRDVVGRLTLINNTIRGKYNRLTQLGAKQMRDIAARTAGRFPEVFGGRPFINAVCPAAGCSMTSAGHMVEALRKVNPQAEISQTPSKESPLPEFNVMLLDSASRKVYEKAAGKLTDKRNTMELLFNDTAQAGKAFDTDNLYRRMFRLASAVQNSNLRTRLTLYDLFDDDNILNNWRAANLGWFLLYGNNPLRPAADTAGSDSLLSRIIADADECIANGRNGATIRIGSPATLLQLACRTDIGGFGKRITRPKALERSRWADYRIMSMAANIQLVFYRSSPDDRDILVKVLLNEQETTLPVDTDNAPFYRWDDVKDYLRQTAGGRR